MTPVRPLGQFRRRPSLKNPAASLAAASPAAQLHAREGGASTVHPVGEGDADEAGSSDAPSLAPRKLPAGAQRMMPLLGGDGSAMQAMLAKRRAQAEASEACSSMNALETSSRASAAEQEGTRRDVVVREECSAASPGGVQRGRSAAASPAGAWTCGERSACTCKTSTACGLLAPPVSNSSSTRWACWSNRVLLSGAGRFCSGAVACGRPHAAVHTRRTGWSGAAANNDG